MVWLVILQNHLSGYSDYVAECRSVVEMFSLFDTTSWGPGGLDIQTISTSWVTVSLDIQTLSSSQWTSRLDIQAVQTYWENRGQDIYYSTSSETSRLDIQTISSSGEPVVWIFRLFRLPGDPVVWMFRLFCLPGEPMVWIFRLACLTGEAVVWLFRLFQLLVVWILVCVTEVSAEPAV